MHCGIVVHVTKQNPDIHAYSARIPKPLYKAVASISAITGESINQLTVKGLEAVVAEYNTNSASFQSLSSSVNSIDATTTSVGSVTVGVPDLAMVRQSYASAPQWSQPRREGLASLSKWTSTEEEKQDE